jgi:hypothetical protein
LRMSFFLLCFLKIQRSSLSVLVYYARRKFSLSLVLWRESSLWVWAWVCRKGICVERGCGTVEYHAR